MFVRTKALRTDRAKARTEPLTHRIRYLAEGKFLTQGLARINGKEANTEPNEVVMVEVKPGDELDFVLTRDFFIRPVRLGRQK